MQSKITWHINLQWLMQWSYIPNMIISNLIYIFLCACLSCLRNCFVLVTYLFIMAKYMLSWLRISVVMMTYLFVIVTVDSLTRGIWFGCLRWPLFLGLIVLSLPIIFLGAVGIRPNSAIFGDNDDMWFLLWFRLPLSRSGSIGSWYPCASCIRTVASTSGLIIRVMSSSGGATPGVGG